MFAYIHVHCQIVCRFYFLDLKVLILLYYFPFWICNEGLMRLRYSLPLMTPFHSSASTGVSFFPPFHPFLFILPHKRGAAAFQQQCRWLIHLTPSLPLPFPPSCHCSPQKLNLNIRLGFISMTFMTAKPFIPISYHPPLFLAIAARPRPQSQKPHLTQWQSSGQPIAFSTHPCAHTRTCMIFNLCSDFQTVWSAFFFITSLFSLFLPFHSVPLLPFHPPLSRSLSSLLSLPLVYQQVLMFYSGCSQNKGSSV